MMNTNDSDDENVILSILNDLVEQISIQNTNDVCDDCHLANQTVHYETRMKKTLCSECIEKRDVERERVLEDLQNLANEVEQRLEAIENTERELDQWRDAQLQKNRDFWDEYRRQVENFSSCRIRTLQYEYQLRQLKNETLLRRLKCAKYLAEHFNQFSSSLDEYFPSTFLSLIFSETFSNHFSSLLSFINDSNQMSTDTLINDDQHILEQLEQFSDLDRIIFLENGKPIDEHITTN